MISSIRASRSSSSIPHRESKKVGKAHFFKTLARVGAGGKLVASEGASPPSGRLYLRTLSGRGQDIANRGDDVGLGDFAFLAGTAGAQLQQSALCPSVTDRHADRHAEQIGVLELHTGTL